MSVELFMLVLSPLLVVAYIGVQSSLYTRQHGLTFAASGRDEEKPATGMAGRAERALRNLIETYGVFVALAVATELSGRSDALTQWGAQIWFWSRWVYLPLYLFAVPRIRSLAWLVSMVGLGLMFWGILF
jgi:uncharacterized MAPEG superfamily protein